MLFELPTLGTGIFSISKAPLWLSSVRIELVPRSLSANHTLPVSAALYVYDWLLTLPEEVAYIWGGQFNIFMALFVFNRYVVLVGYVPVLALTLSVTQTLDDNVRRASLLFFPLTTFLIYFYTGQFITELCEHYLQAISATRL